MVIFKIIQNKPLVYNGTYKRKIPLSICVQFLVSETGAEQIKSKSRIVVMLSVQTKARGLVQNQFSRHYIVRKCSAVLRLCSCENTYWRTALPQVALVTISLITMNIVTQYNFISLGTFYILHLNTAYLFVCVI